MKISGITVSFVKTPRSALGHETVTTVAGTTHIRLGDYAHIDSTQCEAAIVEIRTDQGLSGWGECQSPIGPEVIGTIIERVLGPLILGRDPLASAVLRSEMYDALRVRGQITGYVVDAIAGLDTALWDLRGRHHNMSIARLAGGPYRTELPAYVSGLHKDRRVPEAAEWAEAGFGVKAGLRGLGAEDIAEMAQIRSAVGDATPLYIDGMWRCSNMDVVRVARQLEDVQAGFFEAPMDPEDVGGHAELVRHVDVPIAIGEPLRTRYQFLPWFAQRALSVAQPDLMRVGPTEAFAIAAMAEAFHVPVAFHSGMATPIGMAATWQVAAGISNFLVQEFQPHMREIFSPITVDPLKDQGGRLLVPDQPGIGITINRKGLEALTEGSIDISA
ncbi:MAG TPA: mandelate racemase/muconate lactonizing enzyme family protein [Acidimicrobiia bacterium]|nr:mandelate racemase/muconate lactonizing enzyme family protein [Acidimicrobiia bacterium]